jgi:hypothetical protein
MIEMKTLKESIAALLPKYPFESTKSSQPRHKWNVHDDPG